MKLSILKQPNLEPEYLDYLVKRRFTTSESNNFENDTKVNDNFLNELMSIYMHDLDLQLSGISKFSIQTILDYLQRSHHFYINVKLPEMEMMVTQFSSKNDSALSEIFQFFFLKFSSSLKSHILDEEKTLFLYAKQLINKSEKPKLIFDLNAFINQHDSSIEDQLTEFRAHIITHFHAFQNDLMFNSFYNALLTFEKDLKIHAMIEDLVFLPKIVELEKQTLNQL